MKLRKTTTGTSNGTTDYAGNYIYENDNLQFMNHPEGYSEPNTTGGYDYIYQYKDHLGNIRLSYKDVSSNSTPVLEIQEENNYYPFGMPQPSRNFDSQEYRYGFQGQEKDDEVKGEGLSVNYKYRMHDPRIGRFFAVDPLASSYPWNSPYAFSENRVIDGIELEGLEWWNVVTDDARDYGKSALDLYTEYEVYTTAYFSMASGLLITSGGIALAPVPGLQVFAAVAITYGVGQTGYGFAKVLDAHGLVKNKKQSEELSSSNNYGHLIGNGLEEKGLENAGAAGYYIGEGIDIATNVTAGFKKLLAKGVSPLHRYLAYGKISRGINDAVTTSAKLSYDMFFADANNKIANVTNLKSTITFVENELGIEVLIHLEASNDNGDKMEKKTKVIITNEQLEEYKKEIEEKNKIKD